MPSTKRDPFITVTTDHDNPAQVILTAYEAGSGATLARKPLDRGECARLVEKLIQPLVRRPKGHWVGQHGYHP